MRATISYSYVTGKFQKRLSLSTRKNHGYSFSHKVGPCIFYKLSHKLSKITYHLFQVASVQLSLYKNPTKSLVLLSW